jgi:hypothetical protein
MESTVTAPTKVCRKCGAQSQTFDKKCPNCGKKYGRRRGGTTLKIMLGVFLGGCLLIAGCVALIAGGVDDATKEQDKTAITLSEFRSVKLGTREGVVREQLGRPGNRQEFESEIPELESRSSSSCIYYNEKGKDLFEGRSFQFCFDEGKLTSKNSY